MEDDYIDDATTCTKTVQNIKIGPCDDTDSSDIKIKSYDYYNSSKPESIDITIDSSELYNSSVCMKFFSNNRKGVMMSEPFLL